MEEKPLILVADDNEDTRLLVSMILNKMGFHCETAESGRAALNKLEAGLTPDLILSDVMMPEMDGYTFFQNVQTRPEWRRIPFIFFTMKDSIDDIQKGRELGVDDYLTKPIMPDALIAAVRGKLRRFKQLSEGRE
ncbi:response regulator [Desulfoferrobacter suflitae]|uniref:response regulator n=1 Tax=Desulfoferrobacter suflitae TaxID=2865782 RepID=UPI002164A0B6|nr:response regulator [Desulfoferrobacter suflitae]MCK8601550.1 response regulator [Desulfoferrobacter suflitae]